MRTTRATVALLAAFQLSYFGWLLLNLQGLRVFALVHLAFLAGAVTALVWAIRPASRGMARAAECLTLAAIGTLVMCDLAGVVLDPSGSREFLERLAAHPAEAWPLAPVIALVVVLGIRTGRQQSGGVMSGQS